KMLEKCLILLCLWFRLEQTASTPILALGAKDFQLDFLRELGEFAEKSAFLSLNNYLALLEKQSENANYSDALNAARSSDKLPPKMTLIKQLLDMAPPDPDSDLERTSVLRSLVFLNRLKANLRAVREASAQEIRQLRLHRLCQQFQRPAPRSGSGSALINEQTIGAALERLNLSRSEQNLTTDIDLDQFGLELYERVKLSGAEIIDNYLQILRGLILDIVDGNASEEMAENNARLASILVHLDAMMATKDFFEKRQKVYAYLKRHLDNDSEKLREFTTAEQPLNGQLLATLEAKGLDLFVIFLFSNFEFLEQVHKHWAQMLPQTPSLLYNANSRQLYDVQQLHEDFMLETESEAKYQAYADALRRLHERTVEQGQRSHHIFEMLNNAAQNVGSVTFNMIKDKCLHLT
ncbi:hypothetical protein KR018_010814, partial [Drosophila ironensis]